MRDTGSARAARPAEALEVVVAARPVVAAAVGPLVAVFARVGGLGGRRARALAGVVVALVSAISRRAAPVRVRLNVRPRLLRVRLLCPGSSTRSLQRMRAPRLLPGLSVERAGRGALVLTVPGRFDS